MDSSIGEQSSVRKHQQKTSKLSLWEELACLGKDSLTVIPDEVSKSCVIPQPTLSSRSEVLACQISDKETDTQVESVVVESDKEIGASWRESTLSQISAGSVSVLETFKHPAEPHSVTSVDSNVK